MTDPAPAGFATPATPPAPTIYWIEAGQSCSALWRSERGAPAPSKVVLADDSISADTAYRLACEGTALLWRGDFQNARHLLQALTRRADRVPLHKRHTTKDAVSAADTFHQHRQAQSQRARMLGMLLMPINADYSIPLRRAPDVKLSCTEVWGPVLEAALTSVTSLRELLSLTSAHEWRKNGLEITALGPPPLNRIYPHYGVFSPVRGEYIALVASAHLPRPRGKQTSIVAFDIGTGTGVLAALLVRRGVAQVIATDLDPRTLACARENLAQLGVADQVQVVQADLFPQGTASLVVCNPPWLPARPSAPIEHAVYDQDSIMLLSFLQGLRAHLEPKGEGWLILSNLAEHLGLRTREQLLAAFEDNGLKVISRIDAKPLHPKAFDLHNPLHQARSKEVTSLWRLASL